MHYRATPLSNGYSPSQLLYSRQIKTILPQNPDRLKPKVINQNSLLTKENAACAYSKKNYDVRHRARNMTPLRTGDNVHVKSFNVDSKVLKAADRPRSYVVDTPHGEISHNRRHLVRLNKEVELNNPTDLQPMVHVQEIKCRVILQIHTIQRLQNLIHFCPTLLVLNSCLVYRYTYLKKLAINHMW